MTKHFKRTLRKLGIFIERIAKLLRAQIRAFFVGFGFFAKCLWPIGYVTLRKTEPTKKSSNFSRAASFSILSILLAATLMGLKQFCEMKTLGFCLQKIQACDLPHNHEWEIPPLTESELSDVSSLLDQPYHLIGYGSECFAFESQDGSTVIKLYILSLGRYMYFKRGLLVEDHRELAGSISNHPLLSIPFSGKYDVWRKRVLGMREYRLNRTFISTCMAFKELKEETGLLYVHLNDTTSFKKHLKIIDKLKIAYEIDLDIAKFSVQKKAIPLKRYLKHSIHAGNGQAIKNCIDSYLKFIVKRSEKGYSDRDILMQNFGMLNDQLIEIDVGSFSHLSSTQTNNALKKELFFATRELHKWLEEHAPVYCSYLDEQIMQL